MRSGCVAGRPSGVLDKQQKQRRKQEQKKNKQTGAAHL